MKTNTQLDKTTLDKLLYNHVMMRIELSKKAVVQKQIKPQKSFRKYISKKSD